MQNPFSAQGIHEVMLLTPSGSVVITPIKDGVQKLFESFFCPPPLRAPSGSVLGQSGAFPSFKPTCLSPLLSAAAVKSRSPQSQPEKQRKKVATSRSPRFLLQCGWGVGWRRRRFPRSATSGYRREELKRSKRQALGAPQEGTPGQVQPSRSGRGTAATPTRLCNKGEPALPRSVGSQ